MLLTIPCRKSKGKTTTPVPLLGCNLNKILPRSLDDSDRVTSGRMTSTNCGLFTSGHGKDAATKNKTTENEHKKAKQPEYMAMADNGAAQTCYKKETRLQL